MPVSLNRLLGQLDPGHRQLFKRLESDGRIDAADAERLISAADTAAPKEKAALAELLSRFADRFEPAARARLERAIGQDGDPATFKDQWGRDLHQWTERGQAHKDVSFTAADGSRVSSAVAILEDRVVSEVRVEKDGVSSVWRFEDRNDPTAADSATVTRSAGGQSTTEAIGVDAFFQNRGRLMAVKTDGVDRSLGGRVYAAKYSSAATLASATGPDGKPVQLLFSQGVHGAFPFPGAHWDEGQIAILDQEGGKKVSLRMPKADEATHLAVSIARDRVEGEPAVRLSYLGHMQDDDGKFHFVESSLVLKETEVKRANTGLWGKISDGLQKLTVDQLNSLVGFEQNPKVLTEFASSRSTFKLDGQEFKIGSSMTALDDGARFNALLDTPLTALNYAPPDSPLLSLIDPREHEARYRFDATFLADAQGFVHDLPKFLRDGLLASSWVTDAAGHRRDVADKVLPDGPPLSSKNYTWNYNGAPVATLTRELVRYRDQKGNVELGFRETIKMTDAYRAWLKARGPGP